MNSCQFVLLQVPLLWQCLRGSDGGTSIVITVVRYKFVVPIYTGMTLPEKDTYTLYTYTYNVLFRYKIVPYKSNAKV